MNPVLIGLIADQMPSIIAGIKALFHRQNPNTPPPTDDEIHAAFEDAYAKSKATNAAWLAAHPEV